MLLDRIDFDLLRLLRKNARMPNKDLAEKVGVAPSTALERIRRMRESKAEAEGPASACSPPRCRCPPCFCPVWACRR